MTKTGSVGVYQVPGPRAQQMSGNMRGQDCAVTCEEKREMDNWFGSGLLWGCSVGVIYDTKSH